MILAQAQSRSLHFLLPTPLGSPVLKPDLNANFRQVDLHGELLPGVDVRVVGLLERSLELVQLVGREGGPVATVLLLAPVAVYVLPAARAELLVAAAAGGVAAVLTGVFLRIATGVFHLLMSPFMAGQTEDRVDAVSRCAAGRFR